MDIDNEDDTHKDFDNRMENMGIYRPRIVIEVKGRPTYEKKHNVDDEKKFVKAFNAYNSLTAFQIAKKFYPVDIAVSMKERIISFIEFKKRLRALEYLEGVMLSFEKYTMLVNMGQGVAGGSCYFFIENAPDSYYGARLLREGYTVKIGGRTDRGDSGDVEPVILIPANQFKPLASVIEDMSK